MASSLLDIAATEVLAQVSVQLSSSSTAHHILSAEEVSTLLRYAPLTVKRLSGRIRLVVETALRLRSASTNERSDVIAEVLAADTLPILVEALDSEDEKVQMEAVSSLTYITAGTYEQTRAAVEAGCVEPLMRLCRDVERKKLAAQNALQAVSNIIAVSIECGKT